MREYLLIYILLFLVWNSTKAQYNIYNYRNTFVAKVDTFATNHVIDLEEEGMAYGINDYELTYTHPDSIIYKYYRIESGKLIDNKKYGIWFVAWGHINNNQRKQGGTQKEYFINNYLIPNTEYFSDSILVDLNLRRITCYFAFSEIKKKSTTSTLKIDYWAKENCDTTFVRCSNIEGNEIFKTTSEYVIEEFNLLYSGYYNRKITGANNGL
ncbi:hypothetical protein [Carboxylicivirga marina]|uniref:Uncharacterized protein n=1 Tax=Carboxylicivirga marina TaxID=2800988 RepID=A0ABS1HPW8_9BACT|nr:hypothetical protein [Carboxylicivirga marina]MBK3519722.1 hypothetical protein [Carboxylicivirga marina]